MSVKIRHFELFGLLLLLFATCSITRAQSGTIAGVVKAADGSIPPGAKVVLIDNESGLTREPETINAVTGKFEIKNVQEGPYLIVACAGTTYNPTRLNIQVKEGKVKSASLTLLLARTRTLIKGTLRTPNIDVSALAFGCAVASTKTDARGRFRFESLPVPPQKYAVRAESIGTSGVTSNLFQVMSNGETEVALDLQVRAATLIAEALAPLRCSRRQGEQTDLTGSYTGKLGYIGAGRSIDATLTISGNDFILTSASKEQTGRITAVTTCGYTAVTMMFDNPPTPTLTPKTPMAVSLQAVRDRDSVRLIPVRGEKPVFVFSTIEAGKRPEREQTRQRPKL